MAFKILKITFFIWQSGFPLRRHKSHKLNFFWNKRLFTGLIGQLNMLKWKCRNHWHRLNITLMSIAIDTFCSWVSKHFCICIFLGFFSQKSFRQCSWSELFVFIWYKHVGCHYQSYLRELHWNWHCRSCNTLGLKEVTNIAQMIFSTIFYERKSCYCDKKFHRVCSRRWNWP